MKKILSFDPNTSFFELTIVRLAASIIIILAISSALVIFYDPALKLTLNLSHEGFNNALTIFRFPIGLTAILIPVIAVLVANHRSEQTKAQMMLTQNQIALSESQLKAAHSNNNFTNYFKHVDEFEKSITKHQEQDVGFENNTGMIEFRNPRRLHKMAFPNVKSGNLKVDQAFADAIEQDINKLLETASKLKNQNDIPATIYKLYHNYNEIAQKYQIKPFFEIVTEGGDPVPPNPLKELVYPIGYLSRAFVNILTFDENYKPTKLLDATENFDYKGISGARPQQADQTMPFDIEQLIKGRIETPAT
ncbi:hypothetical protein SAMN04490189_4607 [Pseudomonas koreensis]|uniref:hypothetical protein n=1 Tax=Pseudomonas koreensis TaxID=198620 RepID=UPI00087B8F54|nr:hypothetical protein [Pseudomonas koreensis]KAB0510906.1 hypothetical protein F7R05_22150 [Pseudomonas koreensis]NNA64348.1 hypothetical protein [Pseudomonas koreensis]GGK52836.1 hypothetical protein GCM10009103_53950 [Pseudomonas koreensis]SDE18917.1 hypothetical protein SAMN04490189_4607 [Pseudomonas koreensis]